MAIGEMIKKSRLEAGLTQNELGAKMGVTGVTVGQWETGKRKPKDSTLIRIALALELDGGYFLKNDFVLETKFEKLNNSLNSLCEAIYDFEKEINKTTNHIIEYANYTKEVLNEIR